MKMNNKKIETCELEELVNNILNQAIYFRTEYNEIYPFGVLSVSTDSFQNINIHFEEIAKEVLIQNLKKAIERKICLDKKYSSAAICYDGLLEGQDALGIEVISQQSNGWMQIIFPYKLEVDGNLELGNSIDNGITKLLGWKDLEIKPDNISDSNFFED